MVVAAADFIRFSHKERSTEIRYNPFARMGPGPKVLAEVFPSADDELTYRRILERDGRPVSDLDEQDRKYRARLEAHQRELTGDPAGSRAARLKADELDRKKQEANVRRLVGPLHVHRSTRERHGRAQPTILVRFVPKPGGEPRTREARVARGFAGRVWVHEVEHDVIHVEAQAIEDVSIGLGLVGRLHKGSSIAVLAAERSRAPGCRR